MSMWKPAPILLMAAALAGCATAPPAPSVAVMPGPGKTLEQFSADDRVCRDYADNAVGINAKQAGANNVAAGAAAGTAIGAAAGALLGGRRGMAGGAGMGLILGTAEGAGAAGAAERDVQRRYDIAYEQCMYAKGNRLPSSPSVTYYGYRRYRQPIVIYQAPPPAPQEAPPPPPPGSPPPPPPGSPPPPPPQ